MFKKKLTQVGYLKTGWNAREIYYDNLSQLHITSLSELQF